MQHVHHNESDNIFFASMMIIWAQKSGGYPFQYYVVSLMSLLIYAKKKHKSFFFQKGRKMQEKIESLESIQELDMQITSFRTEAWNFVLKCFSERKNNTFILYNNSIMGPDIRGFVGLI